MKDFIIFLNTEHETKPVVKVKEARIEELRTYPGSSYFSRELEVVIDGKLMYLGEHPAYNAFKYEVTYYPRISRSVRKRITASAEFTLWQIKESPLVTAFDVPRAVARIGVALASMMLYGNPFAMKPINITRKDFIRLKELIQTKRGKLTRIHVKRRGIFGKVELTASNIKVGLEEEYPNIDFNELLRNASIIHSLGFSLFPPAVERLISFRITRWGGGQIYSPSEPSDYEILIVMDLLKEAFFPGLV